MNAKKLLSAFLTVSFNFAPVLAMKSSSKVPSSGNMMDFFSSGSSSTKAQEKLETKQNNNKKYEHNFDFLGELKNKFKEVAGTLEINGKSVPVRNLYLKDDNESEVKPLCATFSHRNVSYGYAVLFIFDERNDRSSELIKKILGNYVSNLRDLYDNRPVNGLNLLVKGGSWYHEFFPESLMRGMDAEVTQYVLNKELLDRFFVGTFPSLRKTGLEAFFTGAESLEEMQRIFSTLFVEFAKI